VRVSFEPFTLDLETRQLTQDGREIHLSPKAFDLLAALIAERPKVIAKEALLKKLWPRSYVNEANLSNLVAELRAALGDRPRAPRFIRTAHGVGYAFFASTRVTPASEPDAARRLWLEYKGRRLPLAIGEHLVGRDETAAIHLQHSTVSRRHARLLVTAEGAVLEDFSSKNGTFRDGVRVTTPVSLADGDAIKIGSVMVTFHEDANSGTTMTDADS
jgi:DNA-binding winged helix-turn-helix (wHTH) protein